MPPVKVSLPSGMRDFDAHTIYGRQYITNSIRTLFEQFGFEPLETSSMENIDTLMGKYGDEGEKLIFKVLNNGLKESKNKETLKEDFQALLDSNKLSKNITERALRYDLTIPLARYIAMNRQKLKLPFKRYQMQNVWRADRPQLGRYREFTQCDADIIGNFSLIHEAECLLLYSSVFKRLHIDVLIHINHRHILQQLNLLCHLPENDSRLISLIDKADKLDEHKLLELLQELLNHSDRVKQVQSYLAFRGSVQDTLDFILNFFPNNKIIQKVVEEWNEILTLLPKEVQAVLKLDLSLARGLDYYTGFIFEVKTTQVKMGSLGGGGRYDKLTSLFGVEDTEAIGISFGIDRIYDVLEQVHQFPSFAERSTKILFFNMGKTEAHFAYHSMNALRNATQMACELFPEHLKIDKQFKYAEQKHIPYVLIIGEQEMQNQTFILRNLKQSQQHTFTWNELLAYTF